MGSRVTVRGGPPPTLLADTPLIGGRVHIVRVPQRLLLPSALYTPPPGKYAFDERRSQFGRLAADKTPERP